MNFFLSLVRFLSIFAFVKIAIYSIMDNLIRKHRIIKGLLFFLMLSASPLLAQNLLTNGEFETNGGYASEYERIYGDNGVGAGQYAIDNTTANHGGGQGWPQPANSSGRFMIVNGFGGNTNPTKIVWTTQFPITVTTNTNYVFSCRVANLNLVINGQIYPAKLQLKINGQTVGSENQLPTNNDWHEWSVSWNSQNATQAVIEIYDMFTGNSGMGDDYALDGMSFVANEVYSVTANNDSGVSVCQDVSVDIDVLSNDIISPNANDAVVTVVTNPSHGICTVLSNNKIRYTFTGGDYSTDQIKYRVTTHGVYAEAWVYITTNRPPTVASIASPAVICAGGSLGVEVPSVTPSGSGEWQRCQTSTGTNWTSFDPTNIPLSMDGWWVRYSATNDCGTGSSNAVQITVTDGPTFTGQTPQIQPICSGGNLGLTAPAFSANGSPILSQGWVASPTAEGDYMTFNLNNIPSSYNGWYIRYQVESSCGSILSAPAQQLTVNVAPSNVSAIQTPAAICDGDDLDVVAPTYEGSGSGSWEVCQTQTGTYQPFSINNVTNNYNGWYLRYKVSNDCGDDYSNVVQIHVNEAPEIASVAAPAAICAGSSFNLTTPTIQNNGAIVTDQGWQIQLDGNWQTLNNYNIPYDYNGCQIRYFAENECGMSYSTGTQVVVNDEPLVGDIVAPAGICAGESFDLTIPQVTWRHAEQGTGSWEIQMDGEWQAFNNNNIPLGYNGCNIRYKAVNGCGTAYSPNNVQLIVFSTDPIDEGEITACDAIYHHGILCNHNDDYVADSVTPNGCTLRVSWHFTLGEAYIAPVQYQEACDSYYWPKTHQTYYEGGVYDILITSEDPQVCDSTYTLDLTINHAPSILNDLHAPSNVCVGSPLNVLEPQFQMNHSGGGSHRWEYATSAGGPFEAFDPSTSHLNQGNYFLRFVVSNACDEVSSNVVAFRVDDAPVAHVQLSSMQVCEGQTLDLPEVNVTWNNENESERIAQWQMSSSENDNYTAISPTMPMQASYNGNWLRFVAHNACGDDVVGPVRITVIAEAEEWLETITACDAITLETGEVVTESQVIDYESYEPCLRIVHQPIEINHSDQVLERITSCHESYDWHGMTFCHSAETQYATVTLSNAMGCDSIVDLQLDFGDYASYTHDRTACDSYVWEMNPNHVYTESSRDSVFVAAVDENECDTWYYLNLTLGHETLVDGGDMTECSGFVWHGVPYFNDAVVYDSLQTVGTRCDSIVAYQLHIIAPVATDTNIMACNPIWWQEHFCEEEGDYQHTFQSVYGCDSIVTLHFSLSEQLLYEFDTLSCEPFQWYEYQCDADGMTCSHLFQTAQGCDSTVVMHVALSEPVVTTQSVQACDYYEYDGVIYDEPGIIYLNLDTLVTQTGCDSIVQIRLEIKDSEAIGEIQGNPSVYVASNLVSGMYRYELDNVDVVGTITWTLSNPEWQILEATDDYCYILVTTPGINTLKAHFTVADCGEMERTFEINAGYFGVEEHGGLEVQVYPNPTKGTVTIEAEGMESVRLVDMVGQVLETHDCGHLDRVILNLNNYTPSVYLLEIKADKGVAKKRVVLCH